MYLWSVLWGQIWTVSAIFGENTSSTIYEQGVVTLDVACRSVCDRDQNGIKRSTLFLGADQGSMTNSERLNYINRSTHFLRYLGGVARFCPLDSPRIEQSRASEWSDQAIKDDFHRSRFLIPVTNASTGDMYVTNPCMNGLLGIVVK